MKLLTTMTTLTRVQLMECLTTKSLPTLSAYLLVSTQADKRKLLYLTRTGDKTSAFSQHDTSRYSSTSEQSMKHYNYTL